LPALKLKQRPDAKPPRHRSLFNGILDPIERELLMTKPKRHHWWPQLQSGHWTNADTLGQIAMLASATSASSRTKWP
jgi:hypothetical protein